MWTMTGAMTRRTWRRRKTRRRRPTRHRQGGPKRLPKPPSSGAPAQAGASGPFPQEAPAYEEAWPCSAEERPPCTGVASGCKTAQRNEDEVSSGGSRASSAHTCPPTRHQRILRLEHSLRLAIDRPALSPSPGRVLGLHLPSRTRTTPLSFASAPPRSPRQPTRASFNSKALRSLTCVSQAAERGGAHVTGPPHPCFAYT